MKYLAILLTALLPFTRACQHSACGQTYIQVMPTSMTVTPHVFRQPTVQYNYSTVTTAASPQQTTIVEGPPVITYAPAPQPMYVNYAPQPTYYAAPCSSCPSGACANGQCTAYGCPSGQCFGGACANGQCSGGSCPTCGGW